VPRALVAVLSVFLAVETARAAPLDLPVPAADPAVAARMVLGFRDDLELVQLRFSLSLTHAWFRQLAPDGTPIVGAVAAVHLAGSAPRFRARHVAPAASPVVVTGVRRLDLDAATARARAAVAGATGVSARAAVALPAGAGTVVPGVWLAVDAVDAAGAHLYEVTVDADDGTVAVGRDLLVRASGTGNVYRPNPITESGDRTLMDNGNADSPELTDLLEVVTLEGLDGSGFLRGDFADVHRRSGRASSPTLTFDFTRGEVGFDEVMAYYHVDRAQRHVQALGFTGAKSIWARPLEVVTDFVAADQSYYDPVNKRLELGTGGVDDAQDADVIVHEYGHGLEYDLIPQYGASPDAVALGEGWGDTLAYAVPTLSDHPALIERACLAPWDATAYVPPQPCMRRVDGTGHWPEALVSPLEPHYDGEIWSGTLFDVFAQPDVGVDEGLRLVLESMFLYMPNESFAAAGQALLDADAELDGGEHQATLRRVLVWHGILATPSPPGADGAVVATAPVDFTQAGGQGLDVSRTLSEPGAPSIRVHFASMHLDVGGSCVDGLCDAIYLYDRDGNVYARLGGARTDVTAPIVPGDTVVVRLVTRATSQSTGFTVDRYDVVDPSQPTAMPDAPMPDAPPETPPMKAPDSGGCRLGGGAGGGAAAWLFIWVAARAARRRRPSSRS